MGGAIQNGHIVSIEITSYTRAIYSVLLNGTSCSRTLIECGIVFPFHSWARLLVPIFWLS